MATSRSRIPLARPSSRPHVALRPIQPTDADALRHAFERLSPETRYQRFHATIRELSPAWLRYLTRVDGQGHVAWVAERDGAIVGVGRFIRLSREDCAEIAFVVADELQGHGVGARLRDRLIDEARARGIRSFVANVLPENKAIRRLLRTPALELKRDTGTELHLALREGPQPTAPVSASWRAAL